ncbi:cadherin-like beta sandwich domain-containing protein, partial [Paenibacillus sepulcri]|nr:cadherin-like beta sandwich domain-containing protein [Paenibacillus sepulcri]
VDSDGLVTPVGDGDTVIRAEVSDGVHMYSAEVNVSVEAIDTRGILSGLTLKGANLDPGFLPKVFDYEAEVPLNARHITITPVAAEADAVITIESGGGSSQVVASGTASKPVVLTDASADITVRVQSVQA